jgi:hypothetical protein
LNIPFFFWYHSPNVLDKPRTSDNEEKPAFFRHPVGKMKPSHQQNFDLWWIEVSVFRHSVIGIMSPPPIEVRLVEGRGLGFGGICG